MYSVSVPISMDNIDRMDAQKLLDALRALDAKRVMLALGVPDTYAMTRGGWSSRQTLNTVYQHTMESRRKSYDDAIDTFFESIYVGRKKVAKKVAKGC